MQQLQELDINGIKVQIKGTIEEPLFDANLVLVSILEYKELNACRFYKDNKKNQLFVKQASGNLPVGQNTQKGKKLPAIQNQYSDTTIYLTEFGLYECLFKSENPYAQTFRFQIMQLLKDIRLGNIKLLIENECEFTNLLQHKQNEITNFITEQSKLHKQIDELKKELNKGKYTLDIYNKIDTTNNTNYIGSSFKRKARDSSHRRNSSNCHLRQAYQQKHTIQDQTLGRFECYNQEDRKYIEHKLIKRSLSQGNVLMNIQMPRFDIDKVSVVCIKQMEGFEETKEPQQDIQSIEQQKNDDLTTICDEDEIKEFNEFKFKVDKLAEFLKSSPQYPNQKGQTQYERSLSTFIQYLRKGKVGVLQSANGTYKRQLNVDHIDYVNCTIPNFIWRVHTSKHCDQVKGKVLRKQPVNFDYTKYTQFLNENPISEQNLNKVLQRFNIPTIVKLNATNMKFYTFIYEIIVFNTIFKRQPANLKDKSISANLSSQVYKNIHLIDENPITLQGFIMKQIGIGKKSTSVEGSIQQVKEFVDQNHRKIKDKGSGHLETKLYKFISNYTKKYNVAEVKKQFGNYYELLKEYGQTGFM